MHYCGILICILSLIFAPCFARKASIQTSIQKIQESIRDTPLLPINDKSYKQFISKSPREYYAVVMLTATSKKYRCAICQNAKTTLEETAIAYHKFDDCPQLFNELRLESVPHLYILPPTLESKPAKLVDHEVDVKALLEGPPSTFKLIEARTSVKIKSFIDPTLILLSISLFTAFLALFICFAEYDFFKAVTSYQNPKLWSVISVICFGVGVSGSIFCIIRAAPLLGYDRSGQLVIFALQGREQNLLEGVIVASLTILFAVSMFSLHYSASIRFPVVRHLAVLFFLAMICTIGIELWKVYVLKTPWYSLKETLPLELWHLLTLGAKKSSGLMRRVWRASEIWLIEGNDWEGFRKKFKALLIDYIIKQLQGIEVIKSYL